ncbi:dienelactone hydrolase family protein [Tissierella praeacuta]|uniref:prolyl oligopeptidase family serine peptidase n=1 Tax=Tissierella praeacuta TaxID=43131 RepID=UPI003341B42B
MVWSIFPYENNFVTTTAEKINGVPCLKFRPKNHEGLLPTIINYHGWHSSKEFKKFESMTICTNGYQVIVPDALYHGDRNAIDHDDPENINKYFWEIVFQGIKESRQFIESVIKEHDTDPTKIAVMGDSMGAITASGVFLHNPNLKCHINFNGSLSWGESIKNNKLPKDEGEYKELIEFYDPIKNEEKIKERAILILHGTEDTSLSIDDQKLFFNKMISLYNEDSDKLQFIEATNINHRITTGMLEKSIMWMKEYL